MREKLILRNWLMELWGLASLCFAELVGQVEIPVGANVIVLILEAISGQNFSSFFPCSVVKQ